jgi:hypothetical protein
MRYRAGVRYRLISLRFGLPSAVFLSTFDYLALSGSLREFDSPFSTAHPCRAAYAVFLGYRLDPRAASQAAWVA